MKVAIIHDYLDVYGGAEILASAMFEVFPAADLYTATYDKSLIDSHGIFKNARIFYPKWSKFLPKKLLILFLPLYFENLNLSMYDLVISSTTHFAKGVRTNQNQIHISYINTPPRFLYGYESSIKNRNAWYMKTLLWPIDFYLRYKDQQFAKRPDFLLCNSNEVKNRIKKIYNREAKVIYPFPQISAVPKTGQPLFEYDRPPYLIISRLESYKNIDLSVIACGEHNMPLRIAGDGHEKEKLTNLSKKYRSVKMLGMVSEDIKSALYQSCKAVICSARNEDFGMSTLEAMMYGKPVIALRSGGYLETIVDGKTGVFFDELTLDSLLSAIKKIDTMKWDSDVIRKHAQTFSKERFQTEFRIFVDENVKSFS